MTATSTTTPTQIADLLTSDGRHLASVEASLWKRDRFGGFIDWGGTLRSESGFKPIAQGFFKLRLEDGRELRIRVANIRVTALDGPRRTIVVNFFGDGQPPL